MKHSEYRDSELESLFSEDPELGELYNTIKQSRPQPSIDPYFRRHLRSQLLIEASGRYARHSRSTLSHQKNWFTLRPRHTRRLAWGGILASIVLVSAIFTSFISIHPHNSVTFIKATSNVSLEQPVSLTKAIVVSFNTPMDESTVIAGLHIQPAVAVTTLWSDNSLTITPIHSLAASTIYTVTIDQSHLVTQSGVHASDSVNISFATAQGSAIPPTIPATLTPVILGSASVTSQMSFTPSGSILVTQSSLQPATPSTPLLSNSSVNGIASVTEYSLTGKYQTLPLAVTTISSSPDSTHLAAISPTSTSSANIILTQRDGSSPQIIGTTDYPSTPLGWKNDTTVVYQTSTGIYSLSITSPTPSLIFSTPPSAQVELAPDSSVAYVYATPSMPAPGSLVNLTTGTVTPVVPSPTFVAFSNNGQYAAWIIHNMITIFPLGQSSSSQITVPVPSQLSSPPTSLAISNDGSLLAYASSVSTPPSSPSSITSSETALVSVPAGTVLGTIANSCLSPQFSPLDDLLGCIFPTQSSTAPFTANIMPLTNVTTSLPPLTIPSTALNTATAFLSQQAHTASQNLTVFSPSTSSSPSPSSFAFSQSDIIDAEVLADNSVVVHTRLTEPSTIAGGELLEATGTLVLTPTTLPAGFAVTSFVVSSPTPAPSGPQAFRVAPSLSYPSTVYVTFDSDMLASSLADSFSVTAPDGTNIPIASGSYDPYNRTETLLLSSPIPRAASLSIATSLRDINGIPLANPVAVIFS